MESVMLSERKFSFMGWRFIKFNDLPEPIKNKAKKLLNGQKTMCEYGKKLYVLRRNV